MKISAQTALTKFANSKLDPKIKFVRFVGQDGRTVPSAREFWRVPGYEHILQVTETEVALFSETLEHICRHLRDRDRLNKYWFTAAKDGSRAGPRSGELIHLKRVNDQA